MPAFAAIGLGISAISSGVNLISGLKRKNEAKKKLARFRRQELRNVADGMQVARLGADLRAAESARAFSSSVDALRSGGVRALVGGLNRAEVQRKAEMGNIAASLEMQQAQIERIRAQDQARIRDIQEKRDYAEIAGLGKEISEGRNQMQQGAAGLAGSFFGAAKMQKAGMLGKAAAGAGGATGSLFGSESGGGLFGSGSGGAQDFAGSFLQNTAGMTGGGGMVGGAGGFAGLGGGGSNPFTSGGVITGGLTPSVEVGMGSFDSSYFPDEGVVQMGSTGTTGYTN